MRVHVEGLYLCSRLSLPHVSLMAARRSALAPPVSTPTNRRIRLVSRRTSPCHLIWLTTLKAVADALGASVSNPSASATPSINLSPDKYTSCTDSTVTGCHHHKCCRSLRLKQAGCIVICHLVRRLPDGKIAHIGNVVGLEQHRNRKRGCSTSSGTSVISSSSSISSAAELRAESPPRNSVSTMLWLCCRHCCRTPASDISAFVVRLVPCSTEEYCSSRLDGSSLQTREQMI